MESKVNYIIAGLFVIVLTIAITLSIIWLSTGFTGANYKIYQINMEESVAGLSVGAPVKYNGVEVGNVKDMKLNQQNPQEVIILVNIREDTPVNICTRATLNAQGLTGIASIELTTKCPGLAPLHRQPGERYPIIPTAPSLMVRIDTAVTSFTNNFQLISDRIQDLLDDENQENIKSLLINLESVSAELKSNNDQIRTILQNTATASKGFPRVVNTLNDQTLPKTDAILDSIQDVTSNVQTITNNLLSVSEQLKQNPSVIIRGKGARPPGPGERQ